MSRPSGPGGCYTPADIAEIEAELAVKNAQKPVDAAAVTLAEAELELTCVEITVLEEEQDEANENKCE